MNMHEVMRERSSSQHKRAESQLDFEGALCVFGVPKQNLNELDRHHRKKPRHAQALMNHYVVRHRLNELKFRFLQLAQLARPPLELGQMERLYMEGAAEVPRDLVSCG